VLNMSDEPDYGNWVPLKYVYLPGILGMLMAVVAYFYFPVIILAVIFLIIISYATYARAEFSTEGGDLQTKIREMVMDELKWDGSGRAIDIGCGNGPLTIMAAKKYPESLVTGIDYWGGMWEYSRDVCIENAKLEGVEDRVEFKKATASDLPFEEGYFDAAMSNLVFHEVKDTKDKTLLIKEALRVVKPGGVFAFQDIFHEEKIYGDIDDLLDEIDSWGVEEVYFTSTRDSKFIPKPLKLPFMVGSIGIIHGKK
jgi:ubiquinone/menaquinone biosynthesis C-methylase UbiE